MIITRDTTTYRNLQSNLSSTSSTINELYIKTSTGIDVDKASESPSSVGTIISCRTDIVKSERYVQNCNNVSDNLSTSEIYLNSLEDLMVRAKEIANTGANDSMSDADRETLADEVAQLQEELLDLANSQVDGKYLFAGYNDQTLPFSSSPVTYNGTNDHIMIEVNPGSTVAKNITGEELFMNPVNLFSALEDLETALTGGTTSDISQTMTTLEEGAEQVRSQQSTLGNTVSRMDDMISMHQNALLIMESTLSSHQDADLTSILSEIAEMETALEATMQVTARVSSLSLLDYL
ncbi:flagellar hook-associated protein FlgL [Desulfobulbus rhabdoformis]|uniref:flagellar hook-associated protein FlgL n=1 Tax=Desulfobulbus rhabdoformis TaxID=34032 RepID=UPI001965764C|nr:flagellar hook-associated protein FlgL [Desulfobulbus rhabdoformis]MBM9616673.1 flagellar hook-associated protein FlgL [Desulfobulbus rhabdoformis]